MLPLPPKTLLLSSPAQREAVASPIRIEILEHMRQAGKLRASVRDLARLTGRPPTALHYHVNLLHKAGLFSLAGTRPPPPGGKRAERLYRPAAEHFALPARSDDRIALAAGARAAGATMRLAQREVSRALTRSTAPGHIRPAGPGRNFYLRRLRAALPPDALAEVNGLIDRLERIFRDQIKRQARRRAPAGASDQSDIPTLCSLTLALAPPRHPSAAPEEPPDALAI